MTTDHTQDHQQAEYEPLPTPSRGTKYTAHCSASCRYICLSPLVPLGW
jgi:hypothetical protein